MAGVLEIELKTYQDHKEELLATAEGRYVLIHKEQVVGIFESQLDGFREGRQRFGMVAILVKQIVRREEPITVMSPIWLSDYKLKPASYRVIGPNEDWGLGQRGFVVIAGQASSESQRGEPQIPNPPGGCQLIRSGLKE